MQYVIRADEPFDGYPQSFLTSEGTVAYTKGLTPEQYAAERGFPVKVLDQQEFDAIVAAYVVSLVSDPIEETLEQWEDALNVLPPCRWHAHRGVNLFHVSEPLTHDIVTWHAMIGDRCFVFHDRDRAKSEHLAAKVAKAVSA